MVVFSNCKINLGLHIVSKRDDGFHNLETVFYPIPFYDVIEVIEAPQFTFTTSGLEIPSTLNNNLCVKAYTLLKKDFTTLPPIHLHLQKNIPMGAGIGGGSANAAYTLLLLNQKFKLGLSTTKLIYYATQLGSDCAFFIENKVSFAKGRGEILEPLTIDLRNYHIALVFSPVHVSTAEAFGGIVAKQPITSCRDIINNPVEAWRHKLSNDFEDSIFKIYPSLLKTKNALYQLGGTYVSMTGSGSTIYGLFDKKNIDMLSLKNKLHLYQHYIV
jgi:4-diphosphocytidyl-2-C-methyl-D-erythritol kinase